MTFAVYWKLKEPEMREILDSRFDENFRSSRKRENGSDDSVESEDPGLGNNEGVGEPKLEILADRIFASSSKSFASFNVLVPRGAIKSFKFIFDYERASTRLDSKNFNDIDSCW